jgi:hypothetical protein
LRSKIIPESTACAIWTSGSPRWAHGVLLTDDRRSRFGAALACVHDAAIAMRHPRRESYPRAFEVEQDSGIAPGFDGHDMRR